MSAILKQLDHTAKLSRIKDHVERLTGCRNAKELKQAFSACGVEFAQADFRLKSCWLRVLWMDDATQMKLKVFMSRQRAASEPSVQPLDFARRTKDLYQHRKRGDVMFETEKLPTAI